MDRSLEVVISVAGVFLFLSVVVLALVEAISGMLAWRAAALMSGLTRILDGGANAATPVTPVSAGSTPGGAAPQSMSAKLLNHPLLRTLGWASGRVTPSYIPPPLFAQAFLQTYAQVRSAAAVSKAELDKALLALPEPERALVESLLGQADATVEHTLKRVEQWFDATMDRVSGVYKRRTQIVSRLLAAILVVGLNVDAVGLVDTFWHDPVARAAAVEVAKRVAATCEPDDPAKAAAGASEASGQTRSDATCSSLIERTGNDPAMVPALGWSRVTWDGFSLATSSGWAKLAGFVLSIFAISLGAPFWFDLLMRVAPGLRQSGPKPSAQARA
jgi:hypothetical protein